MATNNNFRRSNVNAKTLQITDPGRSSFNLGHKNELSIPFGKVVPVSHRILLPSDTFQGSIKPNFHLEKIATPSIGPTRLDTHTFVVNFRRINNQMRENLEKGRNFFPKFSIYEFIHRVPYAPCVAFGGFNSLNEFFEDIALHNTNVHTFIQYFWNRVTTCYKAAKNNFVVKNFNLYYQYDKVIELSDYYEQCLNTYNTYYGNSKQDDFIDIYKFMLIPFLKPWVGSSSLFDYLGYPVFTEYNKIISYYQNKKKSMSDSSWQTRSNAMIGDFNNRYNWTFFAMKSYLSADANQEVEYFLINTNTIEYVSELPLRAYYAVWYDYLRNWHIEERSKILDPDQFNNELVIPLSMPESELLNDTQFCRFFMKALSFCVLRSRDFNSDFLTTIQTDDDFRHVYSPIFNSPAVEVTSTAKPLTPQNIAQVAINMDSVSYDFPNDTGDTTGETYTNPLYQDLQTMRRAGMLEKWLARNYYFPDTYVGRLQARFGVRPSDYEVLVSNYLGGSETFITGTELVANMSTSETVVGSRNLKADMSTQDNFSGTVMDYSYLISVVSTVPIVSYDVLHPSVNINDYVDYPQPEFATDTRVEARVSDFLRGFDIKPFIGYVPRYYMFRTSADETHGRYLTDYRTFNWFRDAFSMAQQNFEFSLNPYSLRVNLPLDAFIGLQRWDDFAYGDCDCQLVVNRALPAAIEVI